MDLHDIIKDYGVVLTASVALIVYIASRFDAALARKRETRARLSEIYFRSHAELLRSERSITAARALFFPGYTTDQVEKVLLVYMFLNAIHLEWHFSNTYHHPKEAFEATLSGFFAKLGSNPENKFIVDQFDQLFSDFPELFRSVVKRSLGPSATPIQT